MTHIVVPWKAGERRSGYTMKVYMAILQGCHILSWDWVLDCIASGELLDESKYTVMESVPAPERGRLFANVAIHISAGGTPFPGLSDFVKLAQLGGATILKRFPLDMPPADADAERNEHSGDGHYCHGGSAVRLLVPGTATPAAVRKLSGRWGTEALVVQWLLDCVSKLMILPVDEYRA